MEKIKDGYSSEAIKKFMTAIKYTTEMENSAFFFPNGNEKLFPSFASNANTLTYAGRKKTGTKESKAIMKEIIRQVGLAMQQHRCAPERRGGGGISEEVTDHSWLHGQGEGCRGRGQ